MTDFLVKRDDLRECRLAESSTPELAPGQALLRVESFGLTANNVTYAVFGETMSYWDFFPAENGWGRVPMWGFATVERSEAGPLAAGTRVFGYLPPSSQLVVTPIVTTGGFIDGSPQRAALPSVYQSYSATDTDSFYRPDTEAMQMLLRPLFFTSFLIDDQLADDGLAERGPILVSSASSKTAIAAAFLLAQRPEANLIGLTSARNRDFVEGLGIYDSVVAYEEIGSLERGAATFVDIAGDGEVRLAVHSHYEDDLIQSITVGVTHWERLGAAGDAELTGPQPAFFFAPARIGKRSQDWGGAGLEAKVADAWHPFCEWADGWLEVIGGEGFEAVESAYLQVLDGEVAPNRAHVLTLPPGDS
jgi:NADPH:quinone reductase-like Zn-dependent oxidoreductase